MAGSPVEMSVYPDDCDSFGHMNQAAFLTLFERAPWDSLAAGPGVDVFERNGVWPVLRKTTVEYLQQVFPGERLRFDLELTRAVTGSVVLPVIASGGVGTLEHLALGIEQGGADAVLAAARARYLPEIALGATLGAYDSRLFPSSLTRSQLTVGVTWPLWNGGQREAEVARASADADIAQARREDAERATVERMSAAYRGYETARAGIELARVGVAVSAETFRVQSARYREGATTILDLLEAQVNLSQAQATLIQARYAARLALAQVETLLGRRLF